MKVSLRLDDQDSQDGVVKMRSGLSELDHVCSKGFLEAGDLTLIASKPVIMGEDFSNQVAARFVLRKKPVYFLNIHRFEYKKIEKILKTDHPELIVIEGLNNKDPWWVVDEFRYLRSLTEQYPVCIVVSYDFHANPSRFKYGNDKVFDKLCDICDVALVIHSENIMESLKRTLKRRCGAEIKVVKNKKPPFGDVYVVYDENRYSDIGDYSEKINNG